MTVLLCAFALVAAGCEDPQQTQTQAFEQAEARYRTGQYDAALDGYQAFLEAYPTSPLAETAELRIRSINREVRSVLMRKDMPRPLYVGASRQSAPGQSGTDSTPADSSNTKDTNTDHKSSNP